MNTLEEILKLLFFIVIGSGIGTFIVQKSFEHKLDKKLQRFSQLYADRLDVIKNLYRLLVRAENGLGKLLSQREPDEEKDKEKFLQETLNKMDEFLDYFEENEILFEQSTSITVAEIRMLFLDARSKHMFATIMENSRGTPAWEKAVIKKDTLREKLIEREMPNLKHRLKEEFQKKYRLLEV